MEGEIVGEEGQKTDFLFFFFHLFLLVGGWRGCGEKGTLLPGWWECKLVQPLWRTVWRFLKKLELELPYDPAIPLLGIHTKETRSERDTCTPMFIADFHFFKHLVELFESLCISLIKITPKLYNISLCKPE